MKAVLLGLALLATPAVLATEGRLTGADVDEIRAVIHRQIDAFRRDDAHSAFALVSPGVQQAFGSPERFLDTVRMVYRAVYRPSSAAFLELVVMSTEVVQPWRTNGCHLVQPARTISA